MADFSKGSAKVLAFSGTLEDAVGQTRPKGSEGVKWTFGDVTLETLKGTRDTPQHIVFTSGDGFRDFEDFKDSICGVCGVESVPEAFGRKIHVSITYTDTVSKKDGKTYTNSFPKADKALDDKPTVEVPYTEAELVDKLDGVTPADAIKLRTDPKIGGFRDVVAVKPALLETFKGKITLGGDGKYHKVG